jgi:hypothetical protein
VSVGIDVAQALTIPAGSTERRVRACTSISRPSCDEAPAQDWALSFRLLSCWCCRSGQDHLHTEAGLQFAVSRLPESWAA